MTSNERQALQETGLWLGSCLLGERYLHYGYWDGSLEVKLETLPEAQEAYTRRLFACIPEGVQSVLDVGCGTGLMAQALIARGYRVDALSPPGPLAETVARRLGDQGTLFRCRFEELRTERRFDLLLFSESFQYIPMDAALERAGTLLAPGGYVLIADLFRTDAPGKGPIVGRHRLSRFRQKLAGSPFRVLVDEDITPQIAPTLVLIGQLWGRYGIPGAKTLFAYFRSRHPWLARLLWLLLGWKARRLEAKFDPARYTAEVFARHCTYRLILLQKTAR